MWNIGNLQNHKTNTIAIRENFRLIWQPNKSRVAKRSRLVPVFRIQKPNGGLWGRTSMNMPSKYPSTPYRKAMISRWNVHLPDCEDQGAALSSPRTNVPVQSCSRNVVLCCNLRSCQECVLYTDALLFACRNARVYARGSVVSATSRPPSCRDSRTQVEAEASGGCCALF